MLANIWHWWIGIVLTGVGLLAVIGVIAGYVKKVVAPQYPGKRHPEE